MIVNIYFILKMYVYDNISWKGFVLLHVKLNLFYFMYASKIKLMYHQCRSKKKLPACKVVKVWNAYM